MARKGVDAEIYEQAPELKEVGAGVGLWGNAFRRLPGVTRSAALMRPKTHADRMPGMNG